MKGLGTIAVVAALAAGATAELQHQHHHLHRQRAAKMAEKRAPVATTTTWVTPVETEYVYTDGKAVEAADAKKCIDGGLCLVVGSTKPTFTPPVPKPVPSSSSKAAEFFESKVTTSTTSSSTSTSTSTSTTPTTTSATVPAKSPVTNAGTSSAAGGSAKFTSGTVKCSTFPSEYGAVPLDWLGLNGWASVQKTGAWVPGRQFNSIDQKVSGGCESGAFCSYACPIGQTKTQWPKTSQGALGQSIGGLWCNDNGYLELSNPNYDTLCMDGVPNVTVLNKLAKNVAVCHTNYPGDEKMSLPLEAIPGTEVELLVADAKTAYQWEGKFTSTQHYVNRMGLSVPEACVWTSPDYPESAGNWAPVIIGAGRDENGVTYLSIAANTPTSYAKLGFNIEITGDINGECYLKDGVYSGNTPNAGCTASVKPGGKAVYIFSNS